MKSDSAKSKRPMVFFAVGVGNTLLDFLFYTLLRSTILPDTGSDIVLAGILSGAFAMICAFTAHSLITWRGSNISHKTAFKFVVFTGFGLWVIRPILLTIFIKFDALYNWAFSVSEFLHLPFSYEFIANTGAFGLMACILLFYNFFCYDRYVFGSKATRIALENH